MDMEKIVSLLKQDEEFCQDYLMQYKGFGIENISRHKYYEGKIDGLKKAIDLIKDTNHRVS